MCVHIILCICHPWRLPNRVSWWYAVSNEDLQKTTRFVIHALTIAKQRFIDVQTTCVNLRLCIFHPWQLPTNVLWWYTVSNEDQKQKNNYQNSYENHSGISYYTKTWAIWTKFKSSQSFQEHHTHPKQRNYYRNHFLGESASLWWNSASSEQDIDIDIDIFYSTTYERKYTIYIYIVKNSWFEL